MRSPTGIGTPNVSVDTAITTMARDIEVPTERSIPPDMMTRVMPSARIALTAACSPIVIRLAPVRNDGLIAVTTNNTTTRSRIGPILSNSFQNVMLKPSEWVGLFVAISDIFHLYGSVGGRVTSHVTRDDDIRQLFFADAVGGDFADLAAVLYD